MSESDSKIKKNNLEKFRFQYIIPIVFCIVLFYISFFHHDFTAGNDIPFFLTAGKLIIQGEGEIVHLPNSPVGGAVLYAAVGSIFQDEISVVKIFSIISGVGIVLLSYFIIRNIFNEKIALLGQIFVAINPRLHFQSYTHFNEIFAVFLVFGSFYFMTKKEIRLLDIIITGALLGISFMIRYQAAFIILAFIVFLLFSKNPKKFPHIACLLGIFFVAISPLMGYNLLTHGDLLDSNSNHYATMEWEYRTVEWWEKINDFEILNDSSVYLIDVELFFKNYLYNLFFNQPDKLFGFTFSIDNLSIIPAIPFIGMIPFFAGLFYLFKIQFNKINLVISTILSLAVLFALLFFGDLSTHGFAIFIVPLVFLLITNSNKAPANFLPLAYASIIFLVLISIIPVVRSDQLFSIWLIIPTVNSLFFIKLIPKMILLSLNSF